MILGSLLALSAAQPGLLVVVGLTAACVVLGLRWPQLRHRIPWPGLTALALVGCVVALLGGVPPRTVISALLCYLLVHRHWTADVPHDRHLAVLLATLMLVVAASAGDQGVLWGLGWLVWTGSLPAALRPPSRSGTAKLPLSITGAGGLGLAALAGGLFVVLPRFASHQGAPSAVNVTGFSDVVELGDVDRLLDDPAAVLRVTGVPEGTERPLFRGAVLDRFDGSVWTASEPFEPYAGVPTVTDGDAVLTFEVLSEEAPPVLLTSGQVGRVEAESALTRNASGVWRAVEPTASWQVWGSEPFGVGAAARSSAPAPGAYLGLPSDLRLAVGQLDLPPAGEGSTDAERLAELQAYLKANHAYTRLVGDDGADAPLEQFLVQRRAGHCEYFAGAMVALLRAEGIPSRLVVGYAGGDAEGGAGSWVLRAHHAHAWVEAWVDGAGWVVADPTPPVAIPSVPWSTRWSEEIGDWWEVAVVEYDAGRQWGAVIALGRTAESSVGLDSGPAPWFGWALLAVLVPSALGGLGWLWARWQSHRGMGSGGRPADAISALHRQAVRHLESGGQVAPASLPPVHAARWWVAQLGDEVRPLEELAWLTYRVRYGGEAVEVHRPRAHSLVAAILRLEVGRAKQEP